MAPPKYAPGAYQKIINLISAFYLLLCCINRSLYTQICILLKVQYDKVRIF